MKKILALMAIVAMSTNVFAGEGRDDSKADTGYKATNELKDAGKSLEDTYLQAPNPLRPFVGVITSPVGNTIQYVAEGVAILGREGVEGAVKAFVAAGGCLSDATKNEKHPGYHVACGFNLVGGGTVVITNTVGYSAGNVVMGAGEILSDLAFIVGQAGKDLCSTLEDKGLRGVSDISCAFGVVMNAAGQVVEVVAYEVAATVYGATNGIGMTIMSTTSVFANLARGHGRAAGESLGHAIGHGTCTVIDTVLIVARLPLALIDLADKGNRKSKVPSCAADYAKVLNGTWEAPVRRARNGDVIDGQLLD